MSVCTYCGKQFKEIDLKPMKEDDNPKLDRKYCPKCLPEVESAKLPWQKK